MIYLIYDLYLIFLHSEYYLTNFKWVQKCYKSKSKFLSLIALTLNTYASKPKRIKITIII